MVSDLKINSRTEGIMQKILRVILILGIVFGSAGTADGSEAEEDIKRLLDIQVQAWNRGDIAEFMAYYWESPDMTFQSGGRRLYGWQSLMDRYRTTYGGDKMGRLTFDELEIKILSHQHAYALGRYRLNYPREEKTGVFTIILRRFPQGWRIIHDHSSS
jgi:beta-aspartyl-peptidase (threonine type)